MTMLGAGLVILVIAFAVIGFLWVLPAWRNYRGKKTVTCPETGQSATVEVDAARVAKSAWAGVPDVRLKDCSRWPERATCGQDCLVQVEG
ncbi:MAG TPA: hypothetical protein VLJ18_00150 [Thermoanaerobaculia bacterium]|nr:hypothetical protein [Thermoanaerobaculia bacterium]